jgi:hypothetical protein
MAKKGGEKVVVSQAIKPIGVARELLPPKTDPKIVRALADKIIDRNELTKGKTIKTGTTVNVGKQTTTLAKYLPNNKTPITLKDQSTTNRIVGLGNIQAEPPGLLGGVGGGQGSSTPAAITAAIKAAPIDTVEFVDESLSAELLLDLLFEDVGGQELLTIARNDTVNGQDVVYQPFKNLGILQEIYNPTNLLKLQETSDKIFSNFTINLRDKIPKVGSGLNGANYYLDLAAGDGIIEFINLKSDEQVEVQIVSAGIIEDVGI